MQVKIIQKAHYCHGAIQVKDLQLAEEMRAYGELQALFRVVDIVHIIVN